MISLFDLQNGIVVPSTHCYTLSTLKDIMDKYSNNYLKVYEFLFYMTCPDPIINPFFNLPEEDKEQTILREIKADFSLDDELIIKGLEFCSKLYATPTYRAYKGIATMLDKLAKYMETTAITHGRDGNLTALISAASKFQDVRDSFKGAYKDLMEEQKSHVRGNQNLAYDTNN